MKKYSVIGLMSGTSLDGLDIAYCEFELQNTWTYNLLHAETLDYDASQKELFSKMFTCPGQELIALDHRYGRYLGESVVSFLKKHDLKPDFIASHGHTIFHQPEKGFTFQAGNGAAISAVTRLPVVCDFRTLDVANGGQGAPLVPIGDRLLFPDFTMCLNLGGIANISFEKTGKRMAYDVCPVNIVLNHVCARLDKAYDEGGKIAREGKVLPMLLQQLEALDYYTMPSPKSMGREWIDAFVLPLMGGEKNAADLLATFCQHIAHQINRAVAEAGNLTKGTRVLMTGGGAFNDFLVELMQKNAPADVQYHLPSRQIIMFKEALIFAFLGVLRIRNEVNALAAVTGAKEDNVGGALYGNFSTLLE